MINERLSQLFTKYDPVIQTLISEVLTLEQAYISMERPHVKEHIDQIISRLAVKEQERMDKSEEGNRRLI
jgi:hypothetical protein